MNNKNKLPSLPKGWVWTTIKELGEIITGTTPSKKNHENYGNYIPFVKPPELNDTVITQTHDSLSEMGAKKARILPPNSVLVSCIGILGKTGINKIPMAFNQQINAIIFYEGIEPKYGFYYFQSPSIKEWLNSTASATTVTIINKSKFSEAPFPFPPLPEQHRIVAKIEELFTRLDAGVEALKKAKKQLKWYHQSVLKAAMEGKLTEEWRKQHKDELKPASILLEKIKEERKKKPGKKYKELPPVDTEGLPELPEGWAWTTLASLVHDVKQDIVDGPFGSNLKASEYREKGIPIIRLQNIERFRFINKNIKFISEDKANQLLRHSFSRGDIVITKLGDPLGKACIVPDYIEWGIIVADVVRVKIAEELQNKKFIVYAINSDIATAKLKESVKGTTRPRVNLTHIRNIPIPFPSFPEQHQIASEIERRFSIIEEMEKIIEQSLKQAEMLKQSILKKAFEGKLVPQDPNDEPASILLEKIKAEKEKRKSEKKNMKDIKMAKSRKSHQRRLVEYVK